MVLVLAAVLALWLLETRSARTTPAPPAATAPVPGPGPWAGHPGIGFRDRGQLAEHYRKHGAEFGGIGATEYLARAQGLRDRPAGGDIREAVRPDGVITRFDRRTGDFLAFDPDGTIRTFFRPNEGEAYFDRQLKRGQGRP